VAIIYGLYVMLYIYAKEGTEVYGRTFIMLKPDCVKKGLIGQVISR
jgi:hypothetical protein